MRAVRRSGLTMPVNNERFVEKAWSRGCDFIILDLEDSVPLSQKEHARTLVRNAIHMVGRGGAEVFVRINHDTVDEDLSASIWPGLKRINYPKTETAEEVRYVDHIISKLELERGIEVGYVEIGANVETARGVANALDIACSSNRIRDFGGGAGYDMSRDLGVEMFVDFEQFVYGKGELEMAARMAGHEVHGALFIPDTTGSVSDANYAFQSAQSTRLCGFFIGGGLHPNVVQPQNEGFTPSPEEVQTARNVLQVFEGIEERGLAFMEVGEAVIDRYEAVRARGVIEWADSCERRNREKALSMARTLDSE